MLKENQSQLKRSIIIAAFDGEEKGLWGSQELADRMSQDGTIGNVKCMMSRPEPYSECAPRYS